MAERTSRSLGRSRLATPRASGTTSASGAGRVRADDGIHRTGSLPADGSDDADVPAHAETDGRRLRRERNRERVVEALLGLYREGHLDPSADDIAERSGVSARSLFRYFDDVHDLAKAALDRELANVAHLVPIAATPDDPTDAKTKALLDERQALWESQANVITVSRVRAPFHPALAANIADSRVLFRQQVAELFAPEVAALRAASGTAAADAAITAVHLLCTFENWRILRVDHGLDVRRTRATLGAAIGALLRPPD